MKKFLILLLVLVSTAAMSLAQSNTGDLAVTVSDPAGVIPGATVVITDNQTGRERTVVTSEEGSVSVPQLEVGTYTVRVTAAGRKTQVYNDVKIDIGRTYSLAATLEAGDVNVTVEVAAGADVINSTSGEISNTVSTRQVQELPLNGRNPLALISTQAGSSSNGSTNTVINGQRSSFTNITRDGLNIQDNFIRANATDFVPDRPNVDDTGEFTITTQNAGAEAGYGASQIQLVTPRGSNDFHGAAFIYNRNSKFAANTFFRNRTGTQQPFLNRNQFGGRFSGPIVKNRLFFFGAYEGFRLRTSTQADRTILTPSARSGVFTFTDAAGVTRTISLFDPRLSAITGVTGINPVIQSRILSNLPTAGNNTNIGDQLNTTGLTLNRQSNQDRESVTIRLDFEPNDEHSFNGVFGYRDEVLLRPDVDAQQGGVASGFTTTPAGIQINTTPSLTLAYRYTPTATFTNEIRGGWNRSRPVFDNTEAAPGFFIQVPLINNPQSGFQSQGRYTTYSNVQDNAVLSLGNHSVRFGGLVQAFKFNPFGPGAFGASTIPNLALGGGATPTFTVNSFNTALGCNTATGVNCINTTQLGTLNNLVALLGGLVGSASLTFNAADPTSGFIAGQAPSRNLRYTHYSLYVSDQWRAKPNLTVNYGLRYELYTPVKEPNSFALEPVIPEGTDPRSAILNPNGTLNFVGTNANSEQGRFFKYDRNNFAPVLSVAYSPNFKNKFLGALAPGEGRTVIRGGIRCRSVHDEVLRSTDASLATNAGLSSTVALGGLNTTVSSPPTLTAPAFQVPRTFAQNNALASNLGFITAIDPNLKVPRTMEYSIGFQREIGFQTALEIRYVGSRSKNLIRGINVNEIRLFDNGFLADFNRARANLLATGNPNCGAVTPVPAGCQPLQLLNTAAFNSGTTTAAALLANATIQNQIRLGQPADLAQVYLQTFRTGNSVLLTNPNIAEARLLGNFAKYNYNSLQVELRRRFSQGLFMEANYTLQKTLTNAGGVGQTRLDPYIRNELADIEYARADYDQEHVFNLSTIYELPFGRGKRFLNQGGFIDKVFGGFQVTSIIRLATGAPLTITDQRGTLNRAANSLRQTANSSLSNQEISKLIGIFRTPCGVFWINPSVIDINQQALAEGRCTQLTGGSGGFTGRAARGFGEAAFQGQVFFNVAPGQTGSLPRNAWNGPMFFNWDASIIKNIPITERMRIQLRAEAFNLTNRANFFVGTFPGSGNVNSITFGRITTTFDPRIIQFVGRFEF
jgi:hypothetical protein